MPTELVATTNDGVPVRYAVLDGDAAITLSIVGGPVELEPVVDAVWWSAKETVIGDANATEIPNNAPESKALPRWTAFTKYPENTWKTTVSLRAADLGRSETAFRACFVRFVVKWKSGPQVPPAQCTLLVVPKRQTRWALRLVITAATLALPGLLALLFLDRQLLEMVWRVAGGTTGAAIAAGILRVFNPHQLPWVGLRHIAWRAGLATVILPVALLLVPNYFVVRIDNRTHRTFTLARKDSDNDLAIPRGLTAVYRFDPVLRPDNLARAVEVAKLPPEVDLCVTWHHPNGTEVTGNDCKQQPRTLLSTLLAAAYRQSTIECSNRAVTMSMSRMAGRCSGILINSQSCQFTAIQDDCSLNPKAVVPLLLSDFAPPSPAKFCTSAPVAALTKMMKPPYADVRLPFKEVLTPGGMKSARTLCADPLKDLSLHWRPEAVDTTREPSVGASELAPVGYMAVHWTEGGDAEARIPLPLDPATGAFTTTLQQGDAEVATVRYEGEAGTQCYRAHRIRAREVLLRALRVGLSSARSSGHSESAFASTQKGEAHRIDGWIVVGHPNCDSDQDDVDRGEIVFADLPNATPDEPRRPTLVFPPGVMPKGEIKLLAAGKLLGRLKCSGNVNSTLQIEPVALSSGNRSSVDIGDARVGWHSTWVPEQDSPQTVAWMCRPIDYRGEAIASTSLGVRSTYNQSLGVLTPKPGAPSCRTCRPPTTGAIRGECHENRADKPAGCSAAEWQLCDCR